MIDPTLPQDLAKELRELKQRISSLERANPLTRASAHDGTRTRVEIGTVTHPSDGTDDYGLLVRRDDGNLVQALGNEGVIYPSAEVNGVYRIQTPDIEYVNSASYTETFGVRLTGWQGSVLRMDFTVQSEAGTTGTVRVKEFFTGATTNALSISALHNNNALLEWDLSAESIDGTWDGTSESPPVAIFSIETKRDTGSNRILIYRPSRVTVGSPSLLGGNATASALEWQ